MESSLLVCLVVQADESLSLNNEGRNNLRLRMQYLSVFSSAKLAPENTIQYRISLISGYSSDINQA